MASRRNLFFFEPSEDDYETEEDYDEAYEKYEECQESRIFFNWSGEYQTNVVDGYRFTINENALVVFTGVSYWVGSDGEQEYYDDEEWRFYPDDNGNWLQCARIIEAIEKELELADGDNANRDKLKQYISNLQYYFDEFDMCEFDGSYYTNEGVVGEWFSEEQIDQALDDVAWRDSNNDTIWLIDESYKYPADVEDQVFNCIFSDLSLNLDQGSIKLLQFKDGDKVLYTESNDEPYND